MLEGLGFELDMSTVEQRGSRVRQAIAELRPFIPEAGSADVQHLTANEMAVLNGVMEDCRMMLRQCGGICTTQRAHPPQPSDNQGSQPSLEDMKAAFDAISEDGAVRPNLLLPVLRRHNSAATEADAQSMIDLMSPNEHEVVSFSGNALLSEIPLILL